VILYDSSEAQLHARILSSFINLAKVGAKKTWLSCLAGAKLYGPSEVQLHAQFPLNFQNWAKGCLNKTWFSCQTMSQAQAKCHNCDIFFVHNKIAA
jgi:hypothetical protein